MEKLRGTNEQLARHEVHDFINDLALYFRKNQNKPKRDGSSRSDAAIYNAAYEIFAGRPEIARERFTQNLLNLAKY